MSISMLDHEPASSGASAVADRLETVYFSHGYDAGYHQAVTDLLGALQPLSERFIRSKPSQAEALRKLLYPFEEFLEQRLVEMTPERSWVEGGLGI